MGSVHKFKRPPKNEKQFRGYRPGPPKGPASREAPRQLRSWQRSVIAWLALILVAAVIWAAGALFGVG